MLKTHISKWGLDKKLKAREVKAIQMHERQRAAAGKKSQFWVRGRPVTWEDVERYIKRSRLFAKLKDSDAVEIGRDTGIICKTPPPDPISAFSIPAVMNATNELQRAEEVVRLCKIYCQGMLKEHQWTYDPELAAVYGRGGRPAYQRLCNWRSKMLQCGDHLHTYYKYAEMQDGRAQKDDLDRAFKLIHNCIDELRDIMKEEDRSLIFVLLFVTDKLRAKLQELGSEIDLYILQLSRKVLGGKHAITGLWERLRGTAEADYFRLNAAPTFLDYCRLNAARTFLDALDRLDNCSTTSSIFTDGYYYNMLELGGEVECMVKHSRSLQNALESMRASASPPGLATATSTPTRIETQRTAKALIHISAYLADAGEYQEVEKSLRVIHRWRFRDEAGQHNDIEQAVLHCEANLSRCKMEWEEARGFSRRRYQHAQQAFGPGHNKTFEALTQHIEDTKMCGDHEEVNQLQVEHERWQKMWIEKQTRQTGK